ncbi:putative toxin-antitoxin system toxin component, PIN family [Methylocystis bryophila]|uniref:Putative toxin-antitoxin system toxin component, PIN family n=1 Tax=Methylocystis bryophila TaxID=655015 RepID=A0A1W6MVM5_9HYPH|nr:putative toxin-antitoxin system toxin component, PIN family [Methylocystis bryophila]ARN81658.1 putative toxin-antitoxin system toxin component, PIN family [Methylocystis bryophila]BDV37702.1 PIN domain-containing protein [Methylocystis bryophila]
MRLVLDTSVVVAGLRSPAGASAELLRRARRSQFQLLASVPLVIEYEAICGREEHRLAAGLSKNDMQEFLNAIVDLVEPVEIWFLWRAGLKDPDDEFVVEAAVNGRAEAIVTFNVRDFGPVKTWFGIDVMTPGDLLARLKK